MLSRTSLLRTGLLRVLSSSHLASVPMRPTRRALCAPPDAHKRPFLSRLLAPNSSGKNPLLRLLGYYSPKSMAMGAGRSLYAQAQQRAHAVRVAEVKEVTSGLDSTKAFVPQFEMLSVHVYMTLHRLRVEKGTKGERTIATAMQCLFDIFWADVRRRMLIEERGMSLLASGKWVKECEKMFFGMAVAFDEAWDDEAKFSECISRNITCLKGDSVKVERFRRYMLRERMRLNKIPIEKIWQGDCLYWDDNYSIVS